MEIIDQHPKKIMEECKVKARKEGLTFDNESLEYIVTNRDLIELSPKHMIPTLYDYWVQDIEVMQGKGFYELYPSNPYETVINTRPAISFYNDNNPDWLNVMIFYHVIAHIDFFQNNSFFKNTWDDDFKGKALADKRLITKMRSEKGRWVDYVIEFTRGIDNLVGYYDELSDESLYKDPAISKRLNFYFDVFLQKIKKVELSEYLKEMESYNKTKEEFKEIGESMFFSKVVKENPEFEAFFEKEKEKKKQKKDLIQYISEHSQFLKRDKNKWMKMIMNVVRDTSIFFQPQIRTKIINEGWASYWHEDLFLKDERMNSHEVGFSKVHARVTSLQRAGLNPYALGMRLLAYAEELAEKGKISYDFQRIKNTEQRKEYDKKTGKGKEFLFKLREEFNDFMLINSFVDQDFVDKHDLFVVGKKINFQKGVWEYYIKSRKAEDYKEMLIDSLYHPPHITVDESKSKDSMLYLYHNFEGKQLVKDYIENTMLGIEYLWGAPVKLETREIDMDELGRTIDIGGIIAAGFDPRDKIKKEDLKFRRVIYTMQNRTLIKDYPDEEKEENKFILPGNPYGIP